MQNRIRSRIGLALCAAALVTAELASAGGNYAVRNGTAAGGGGIAESGGFRVVWTVGEPAMGTTEAGRFRLTSGYPATIGSGTSGAPDGGHIFGDGFENP